MAYQHRHPKFLQGILTSGALVLSLIGLSQTAAFALQTQTAAASAQTSSAASERAEATSETQLAAANLPQNPPPQNPPPPSRPQRISPAQGRSDSSSQGSQYGQNGFVGEPINLNVVNADIRDILNYITEQYGVNFVIDSSVSGRVPVTVNVTNVPWNVALDSILRANGLGVEVNGNILRVAAIKTLAAESEAQRQVKENQLDNSPLVTEFIRLNYARASGTLSGQAGNTANFSGGQPSFVAVSSASQQAIGNNLGGQQVQGGGLLQIIRRRLSRRGGIEVDERTNTLIITDVKQNLDAIRQLVILLDQPEPQVEIETRIVIANRNFSRDLGVQLSAAVFNINRGGGGSFSTVPGSSNTTGLNRFGIPTGIAGTPQPVGNLGATGPTTVIGLTTGIFGTAQISAAITAAEQKGQARIIATPRVTALNNRPAQIETGQQIPVITPQIGVSGGGGGTLFTTTYVSIPLRLSVTPQITDAGTVLMKVTAENNSINTAITVGGTPGIDTQRMQTEVLVPDGGTTVVGGSLFDSESDRQFRTPGLGTLPVVGNLFKRKAVDRQTNEILFFITPRIYRPDYQGRPTSGTIGTTTRTVQIQQPVPLGNPPSNNDSTQPQPRTETPAPQNVAPSNPSSAPAQRP